MARTKSSSTLPSAANTAVIEAAYEAWQNDPDAVDPTWRAFFQGFTLGSNGASPAALVEGVADAPAAATAPIIDSLKQSRVHHLINTYRAIGHFEAHLDPLSDAPAAHPKLALAAFGLTDDDLDTSFDIGTYLGGGQMKLRDILIALRTTYCDRIGVEYMHIQDVEVRQWLQEKMEAARNQPDFAKAEKIRILRRVHKAELFERFLHTKYVGQKRFSLEGGETMVAAVDSIIEHCPKVGVEEVVMGMAHRGRLNILTAVMRKNFDILFEQFSENYVPETVAGDGDVKYHLGYEAILETASGKKVEVRLAANPSHLEIVNPVVEGKARARQRARGAIEQRYRVLPLLIHGDAAFAGQGIVTETLQMSQLPGYTTGGTLHIVVNNQIGFTTEPRDSRSTPYCTDVAKMVEAPIFHVNGDDPEVVCHVARLALEFRVKFQRDVVIDMYCYRKHGHNETDEPAFTQPLLYKKIATHPPISAVLTRKLVADGTITEAKADAIRTEYSDALEKNLEKAKATESAKSAKRAAALETKKFAGSTAIFQPDFNFRPVATGTGRELLDRVARSLTTLPASFKPNPKIRRFLDARATAHQNGGPIDWGFAEALAFGTLVLEGVPIRLSGQDCERGTFSHRHAVLHDMDTNETYAPLKNLDPKQVQFCVYNSLLSEAAVLGFDYGYSLDYPDMLCIWEAQFGDFANGAQVVIDQFLAAGESKWHRTSGLVLLLPHGYEGQGPEHSSARLERFLQLCAEDNIQVANITSPANFFHALRRQVKREVKKPLVVMSPKSLLRHPAAVSKIDDFTHGAFQEIIDDSTAPAKASRVILCSGKVYYDLCDYRAKHNITDAAIVRVEQLYPLHRTRLAKLADHYRGARVVWCQDEPQNMGAWSFIAPQLAEIFCLVPLYAGRDAAASPAVGALALHRFEQTALLNDAFNL
ncbi:MAG: 2-oxoglutarate dehydrogenase E1 component [Verrucomicrobia bacterium]|nr:2-oxoglutarate dehydrogenase E1 component [Verrucomicrobiota bacterium]